MKFAIAIYRDGAATESFVMTPCGRFVETYESGAEAAPVAQYLNDMTRGTEDSTRYRVAKYDGDNGKPAEGSSVAEESESEDWRKREESRFESGEYMRVPWDDSEAGSLPYWWRDSSLRNLHYPHMSKDKPGMIAFTESEEKGAEDKQLRIRAGRYLTRFFGEELSPETIAVWAAKVSLATGETGVQFAKTPDEIEHVYTSGPSSCMAYGASHFDSPFHPVRVYGYGDLAVAYLRNAEGDIAARVLCWPANKEYGRIYGDGGSYESALENMLCELGYSETDCFSGARITRHEYNGAFVCPYIDGDSACVDDMGDSLRIAEYGEYNAQCTNGLTEAHATCDNCGGGYDSEDSGGYIDSRDMSVCDSCYSEIAFHCDDCCRTHHIEDTSEIDGDSSKRVCDSCASEYPQCDDCGERCSDDNLRPVNDGDESVCDSCHERNHFNCYDCGEPFSNDRRHDCDGDSCCGACSEERADNAEEEGESPIPAPRVASEAGKLESLGQARLRYVSPLRRESEEEDSTLYRENVFAMDSE